MTLSTSSFSVPNYQSRDGDEDNTLTLSYSGDFSSDWNLSIRVERSAFDVYEDTNYVTFDPIPVRATPLSVTLSPDAAMFPVTGAASPLPGYAAQAAPMRHLLNRAVGQELLAPTNLDNRDLAFMVTTALPAGSTARADRSWGGRRRRGSTR